MVGMRLANRLQAGEALLWSDLATIHETQRELSTLVTDGMRAVSVRTDTNSAFGGLIRPGDRVDLLFHLGATTITADERMTLSILQNMLVLAVDADMGDSLAGDSNARNSRASSYVNQIVLSATPEQAQLIAYAQERGRLSLVLRNPNDITILDGLPETTEADLMEAQRRIKVQRRLRLNESPSTSDPASRTAGSTDSSVAEEGGP